MSFAVSGDAYDRFMGRYSGPLAPAFADFADVDAGMQVLRIYWEAARALDHDLEGERRSFGTLEDLDSLWRRLGFDDVVGGPLEVESEYQDFDVLWNSFLLGVGPAG